MNFGDPRLPLRFWNKAIPEPNTGCWIWIGSLDTNGYGLIWNGERVVRAHQLAYRVLVGEVPDGLVLDHLRCDTPLCRNPAHLNPTTQHDNVMRGKGWGAVNARKTVCNAGHPLTEENIYRRSGGRRECRTCRAAPGYSKRVDQR